MVKIWIDYDLIVDNPQKSKTRLRSFIILTFSSLPPTLSDSLKVVAPPLDTSRSPSIRKLSMPRPSSLSSPLDVSIYRRVSSWRKASIRWFLYLIFLQSFSLFMCHFSCAPAIFFWFWSSRKLNPTHFWTCSLYSQSILFSI
jgi:hypothetical protein